MSVGINLLLDLVKRAAAALGEDFLPQNFVEGWLSDVWQTTGVIEENEDKTIAKYEFRYHNTVNAKDAAEGIVLEPLFTSFTVPAELDGEDLAHLANMVIKVEGHAIQKTGFDTPEAAWAAFDAQFTVTEDAAGTQNPEDDAAGTQTPEGDDTTTNP